MPVHGSDHRQPGDLVIGLVNNMPSAAKRATERQFADLLTTASQALNMRITWFVLETLPSPWDAALGLLREARPDGLIVTGAEPQSAVMTDEPFWPVLARLVDWAGDHTISTVWSCLAAHAAVFRLDQIRRRRLPQKLSGVFTCTRAADHPLLADAPSRWPVPHSRYNTLNETELHNKGYTILSHAPGVGADSFVKQSRTSLFLLLQGHPEYGSASLLYEYRRDVRQFLVGQRDRYPDMPEGYFEQDTTSALANLREQAVRRPNLDLLTSIDAATAVAPERSWHAPAVRLYASWLSYLGEQKAEREGAATRAADQWRIAS